MTSESVPATVVDAARESERISQSRLMRLKKLGAYISLATIVGGVSGVQIAHTADAVYSAQRIAEVETKRFSGIEAGSNAPFVIAADTCDEIDLNDGLEIPSTVQRNREIEQEYKDERSTIVLHPKRRVMSEQPTIRERIETSFWQVADRLEMTYGQLTGAIDTLNEARHQRTKYTSELTGMEVVFSGTADYTVDERNFEAMQRQIFNPDNYEHSQQKQLVKCVEQKLIEERIKAGRRMHVLVGAPGTVISDFRIMPKIEAEGDTNRGVALPINLVPLPRVLEGDVLIMVTPGNDDELKLNAMLGHELYHAGMHLIDLPIRDDPDEKQAQIAEEKVVEPWLDESRKTLSYR